MDVKAIRIREEDSVATLLEDARAGDAVRVTGAGPADAVTALDPIPFGHKVALRRIAKGEEVVKYGESIGRATADIPAGAWVHVQNLASDRGRGDVDSGTASPLSSVDTVMVTVTTSVPMDDDLRAKVKAKAEKDLESPVYLVERVDPSILGGIILEQRGKRYDASVRAQLSNIRKSLSGTFIGVENDE